MSIWEAILLGVVQGLTEFLPVSSSGHLVITQQLLGVQASSHQLLGFDLALHFGTLLSVVAVFYKDIGQMIAGVLRVLRRPSWQAIKNDEGAYLAWLVILGTIPAAVIGIGFKDFFRSLFDSALIAGAMLLITGTILWLTRYVKRHDRQLKNLCGADALMVGCAQALAIFPGISRSGSTIAAALFSKWDKDLAARYSFLLAIPAIVGGIVFELEGLSQWSQQSLLPLILGVATAALAGFLAIRWLLGMVRRGQLHHFAYYCWAVGLFTIIYFNWR